MYSVDYNIEFAHIYADQIFSKEQVRSIEILHDIVRNFKKQGKSFVTVILIDEYNPQAVALNENDFIDKVKSFNVLLDFIAYESKLSQISDRLIADLPQECLKTNISEDGKKNLVLEIKNREIKLRNGIKNTCALLTACWLLVRLGRYPIPGDAIRSFGSSSFEANKIITILPEKYEKSEKKALDIIKALRKEEIMERIHYKFFKE